MNIPVHPIQGYKPSDVTPASQYTHIYCGENHIAGAWCPKCQKPMIVQCLLDTRDPRLGLLGSPFSFLPLVCCWFCEYWVSESAYQVLPGIAGIRHIHYPGENNTSQSIPYSGYPDFFPEIQFDLHPIPHDVQWKIQRRNRVFIENTSDELSSQVFEELSNGIGNFYLSSDQIGGEPILYNFDTPRICPNCMNTIPIIASFSDWYNDNLTFSGIGDDIRLYSYCSLCNIIVAIPDGT